MSFLHPIGPFFGAILFENFGFETPFLASAAVIATITIIGYITFKMSVTYAGCYMMIAGFVHIICAPIVGHLADSKLNNFISVGDFKLYRPKTKFKRFVESFQYTKSRVQTKKNLKKETTNQQPI
ncbi:hypothetical protein GQR58_019807 [Nymphon striatum]|nr:hypothetical protein GQR58_019807 [Nymphon striatum]